MNNCSICDSNTNTTEHYGYHLCSDCLKDIGLFTPGKVQEHMENKDNYEAETREKLAQTEKQYIQKKVKLLHILDTINDLS